MPSRIGCGSCVVPRPCVARANDARQGCGRKQDTLIVRIVQRALSDQGKTLARRATENHINLGIDEIRAASNIVASDVYNTATNRPCLREVVLVSGTVNWIDFDGSGNIETSLFKAQGQAAGTGEQVNPDGAMRVMA